MDNYTEKFGRGIDYLKKACDEVFKFAVKWNNESGRKMVDLTSFRDMKNLITEMETKHKEKAK